VKVDEVCINSVWPVLATAPGFCLESATMTPWQRDVTARALYKRRRREEAGAAPQWQLEAT